MLGRLYSPEVCCDTSFSHQQCIIAGTQPVGAVNIFSEVKKTGLERTSSDCIDFLIFRSKITYHDEDMRNFQNRSGARDLFKKKKNYHDSIINFRKILQCTAGSVNAQDFKLWIVDLSRTIMC